VPDPGGAPAGRDPAVESLALRVWQYKQGEQVATLIHLGDRLGLYRAMRGRGPMTAADLAARTGLSERLLREWLRAQAAAGLLDTDTGERFELTGAGATVLADEETSEWFAAGAFGPPPAPAVMDGIATSFHTGLGLPYDAFGPEGAHATARSLGPWVQLSLVPQLLPRLDGVVGRLEAGAAVADVGCGGGVALEALALAFPRSRFFGVDPSRHAVDVAADRLADAGVKHVELRVAGAEALAGAGPFDLVLTFDCLHDMAHPEVAAEGIADGIAAGGTWLVKEIRSTGNFVEDRRNPMLAMMYSISLLTCLQSSLSEPGSPGYGTLGLPPERVRALAHGAGFGRVDVHDIGEPANLYYEIRR
jgi:2-polyprenyl-3-methyl-5-hydroxy-6-metoxy-1,4-benzoquinol methylase